MNATSKALPVPGRMPWPRNRWIVPVALIFLSLIPLTARGVRLGELASGADIMPKNERFFASPVPVVGPCPQRDRPLAPGSV